jgi:hypothetical protein
MKNIILVILTVATVAAYAQTEPKNNWTADQKAEVKGIIKDAIKTINEAEETLTLIDASKEQSICNCGLNIAIAAYPDTKDYDAAMTDEGVTSKIGKQCFAQVLKANKAGADKFVKDMKADKATFVTSCEAEVKTTFTPKGGNDYCACMYQKLIDGSIPYDAYLLYTVGLDTTLLAQARLCIDDKEILSDEAPVESDGIQVSTDEYDEETLYKSVVDNKESFVTSCTDGLKEDWGAAPAKEYCQCMFDKVKTRQITATQLIKISNGEDADAGTLKAATECIPDKIKNRK